MGGDLVTGPVPTEGGMPNIAMRPGVGNALLPSTDSTFYPVKLGSGASDVLGEQGVPWQAALNEFGTPNAQGGWTFSGSQEQLSGVSVNWSVLSGAFKGDVGESVQNSGRESLDLNLATPSRTNHILNGDATGGGHLWPGAPGKSSFPQGWSENKIMNTVSDIATDPAIPEIVQSNGRIVKNAIVDGVEIRVVLDPPSKGGGIVTAFPTNAPRNPK
jgi:hypothetical protein